MKSEAWEMLSAEANLAVWDRFYDQFAFRPSTDAQTWPSIREPRPSITYSISSAFGRGAECFDSLVKDLCIKMHKALSKCTLDNEYIYALEWQHRGFALRLTGKFDYWNPDAWQVQPLPNGDYPVFLHPTLDWGLFGHPWERSLCIFGKHLLSELQEDLPLVFDRRIRWKDAPEPDEGPA